MAGYLRLRQICLVASDLDTTTKLVTDVLGVPRCYTDPNVGKYGLHNSLFAMDGTFLEIVSPTQPGTAGGRYLERRKGDGGYMYIVDCDDLGRRREHFKALNARIVEDVKSEKPGGKAEGLHLHPRDTGGCLLSVDRHSSGADMMGAYLWAGADWQRHASSPRVSAITGARMQCNDPQAVATRWSELLERPVRRDGDIWTMDIDNARARFSPLEDDRGEGLSAVRLSVKDKPAILDAAKKAGAKTGKVATGDYVELVGVRFVLV
ncbi:MAG TPA: VOC family protein [Hyphomonadaceae bacterium]|nr:VOC family protein [Hyphomonadaceae bacterium]